VNGPLKKPATSRLVAVRASVATRQAVVVAVATLLLLGAGLMAWKAAEVRDDPVLTNRALLDLAAQEKMTQEVSRSLVAVLSYDWSAPEATRAMADRVLRGQAREEYDTLFASLQERAPGQKLTLTAQVQVSGVQEMSSDRATLLVFLDQSSTREKDKEASVSAAQLRITAERKGEHWAIIGLEPL